MSRPQPQFHVRLAQTDSDLAQAQRLRYDVFVTELGGDGPLVDHAAGREADAHDAHADHLLLCDNARPADDQVIGVYRLMNADQAAAAGGFYSAQEFDLTNLMRSGRRLLELGRSCLHRDYRGGAALHYLWHGLAAHVMQEGAEVLFGTASFHGTDLGALVQPLSYLHDAHLAPPDLRVTARPPGAIALAGILPDDIDRVAALRACPALIKAYLRLGGVIGDGAFVDRAFNTTDVCLILDVTAMDPAKRMAFTRGPQR